MEVNTEINKVFGTEMAKLFASTISEEEMQKAAKQMWERLNKNTNEWGSRRSSDIEKYIKDVLLKRLQEKILAILQEPENDEEFEKRARKLISDAREIADKAIVKSIATNLCQRTLSAWNVQDKFVDDVLRVLYVEKSNGRL